MSEDKKRTERPAPVVWPAWSDRDGYAPLAAYVAQPDALDELRTPGVGQAEADDAKQRQARAAELYELLRRQKVKYAREKRFVAETTQQVRSPRELIDVKLGTCLDFATTYATMCMASWVNVLLAVVPGHAFVVLTPKRQEKDLSRLFKLPGFKKGPDDGVLVGELSALYEAADVGLVVPVEATLAKARGKDFAAATKYRLTKDGHRASSELVHLVDVPMLRETREVLPLPRPTGTAIRRYLPNNGVGFRAYKSDRSLIAKLGSSDESAVIYGRPGQGKSMIARRLVEEQEQGAAWFLDASEPQALVKSLASTWFNESDEVEEDLDLLDREGRAYEALARLREAEGGWLVVLDNADGDPGKLRKWLPASDPARGRRVVVTTTNQDWKEEVGFNWKPLPDLKPADLAALGPELKGLIRGRRLMLEAFRALIEATEIGGAEIAALAPARSTSEEDEEKEREEELHGPIAFWEALRQNKDFGEPWLRVCAYAAYLPPDNQPISLLGELAGKGAKGAFEPLEARGLIVRDPESESIRMHRLFGAAIRHYLDEARLELRDEVVFTLAADKEEAHETFDRYGDLDTISRLDRRLTEIDADAKDGDEDLGIAEYGVAGLLEGLGRTEDSGWAFKRAQRHLAARPLEVAVCLVGRARPINQHHKEEPERLREAVGWAREAQQLFAANEKVKKRGKTKDGKGAGYFRALAMEGLLTRALSKYPEGETPVEVLHRAMDLLVEADEGREKDPEVGPIDKARSRFNLGGTWVDLAKAEPEQAAAHLDKAWNVYDDVRMRRLKLYPVEGHPHVAACQAGLGFVAYYRATLLSPMPRQRSTWLREATDWTMLALKQRELVDGSVDGAEALKSTKFLAKVALARIDSPKQPQIVPTRVFVEAMGELMAK